MKVLTLASLSLSSVALFGCTDQASRNEPTAPMIATVGRRVSSPAPLVLQSDGLACTEPDARLSAAPPAGPGRFWT